MKGPTNFKKPPAVSITYRCNRRCPYCFTAHFKKLFPEEMSLDNFEKLADWANSQDLRILGFLGGESTQHTRFAEIIKIAHNKGIRIILTTNNIFDREVANAMSKETIHKAVINFNEPTTYSKQELKIFYRNLMLFKEKEIETIIRCNLFYGIKGLQHIENACEKYGISQVYFAFTTPDTNFSKPYTTFEEMRLLFPLLKRTIENLEETGVKCLYSLPLPKCALEDKDYRFLEKRGARAKCGYSGHGQFMPLIVIQPDLSVNACGRLPFKLSNILKYEKIEDVWVAFRNDWERIASKPLFEECNECAYWKNGECNGSCLVYKLAKSPEAVKYGIHRR